MRFSFLTAAPPVAIVVAVFACSSAPAPAVNPGPDVPDGGRVLADGAVVGPDGDVVIPDSAVVPDTSKPSKVNLTDETVSVMGQTRKYLLAVPKTYDPARKYPLVIALPGDAEDGNYLRGPVIGNAFSAQDYLMEIAMAERVDPE